MPTAPIQGKTMTTPTRARAARRLRLRRLMRRHKALLAVLAAVLTAGVTAFSGAAGETLFGAVSGLFSDDDPVTVHTRPIMPPQPITSGPGYASSAPSSMNSAQTAAPALATNGLTPRTAYAWVLPKPPSTRDLEALNRLTAREWGQADNSDGDIAEAFGGWIHDRGGADAGESRIRVTLTAGERDITITGLYANIVKRSAPLRGAYLTWPPQGEVDPVEIGLNLDEARPAARYFERKAFHLSPGKPLVLDVTATTSRELIEWRMKIHLLDDGKPATIDAGRLLRTTPARTAYEEPTDDHGVVYLLDIGQVPAKWIRYHSSPTELPSSGP
jgi:hypothetical protein